MIPQVTVFGQTKMDKLFIYGEKICLSTFWFSFIRVEKLSSFATMREAYNAVKLFGNGRLSLLFSLEIRNVT